MFTLDLRTAETFCCFKERILRRLVGSLRGKLLKSIKMSSQLVGNNVERSQLVGNDVERKNFSVKIRAKKMTYSLVCGPQKLKRS